MTSIRSNRMGRLLVRDKSRWPAKAELRGGVRVNANASEAQRTRHSPESGVPGKSGALEYDVVAYCVLGGALFVVRDLLILFLKVIFQDRLHCTNAPPTFCTTPERCVNLAYTRRSIVPRHRGLDFRVAEHVA